MPSITLTALKDHISVTFGRIRPLCNRRPHKASSRDILVGLFDLAGSLEETDDIADLDEAMALDLRPTGRPDRRWSLYNLAVDLVTQGTLPDNGETSIGGKRG